MIRYWLIHDPIMGHTVYDTETDRHIPCPDRDTAHKIAERLNQEEK
jgi:hypothetical protein